MTILIKATDYDSDKDDKKVKDVYYYENDRLSQVISYSSGKTYATTNYNYDSSGKLTLENIEYFTNDKKRTVKYYYQGGLLIKEEMADDGKVFYWTEYKYDDLGRKIQSYDFYSDKPDKPSIVVTYYYDDNDDKPSDMSSGGMPPHSLGAPDININNIETDDTTPEAETDEETSAPELAPQVDLADIEGQDLV